MAATTKISNKKKQLRVSSVYAATEQANQNGIVNFAATTRLMHQCMPVCVIEV